MNKDLEIAKKTVRTEIQALKKLSASLGQSSQFSRAVSLCTKTKNKIVVVGVGKSFIISLKVASTLSSLGSPAVGFSANDLQHGGLGFLSKSIYNTGLINLNHSSKTKFWLNYISFNILVYSGYYLDSLDEDDVILYEDDSYVDEVKGKHSFISRQSECHIRL